MYSYVARQPILDINRELFAYELLFRDGKSNAFPDVCPDEATSKILAQNHLLLGLDDLCNGKLAFINFHEDALLHHFPTSLPPDEIYVEILEDVPISDELVIACKKLKKMGYKLALDDHDFDPKWDVFLPFVDMIKVDIKATNMLMINKYLRRLASKNTSKKKLLLLAEKVETAQEFEQLKLLGFEYYQGYFFARPEIVKQKSLSPNKQVLIELISETTKEKIDFDKITRLIERDVSLSYKLLRFINSSAFTRRQSIGSLKHALNYMGELELKKFIALIALANLGEGKPSELINLSIIRARFCAQIAQRRQDNENPPMAFLTGLFSLVDALLDQSLEMVMKILPISEEIKTALTNNQGYLADYLAASVCFEKGQWQQLEVLSVKLGVSMEDIGDYYQDALQWSNSFNNG
jgi:EAL and modified HD-GYP domain-containing signal transduction protein